MLLIFILLIILILIIILRRNMTRQNTIGFKNQNDSKQHNIN